jgi:hypothetical protein
MSLLLNNLAVYETSGEACVEALAAAATASTIL